MQILLFINFVNNPLHKKEHRKKCQIHVEAKTTPQYRYPIYGTMGRNRHRPEFAFWDFRDGRFTHKGMMETLNLAAFRLGRKNSKVIFIDCLPNAEYVLET